MSADSTDSERTASIGRSRSRSRSILRQVRATFTGRPNSETELNKSKVMLRNDSRKSRPRLTTTPVAFSHRLSLLSQMKSHFIGQRKYRQTAPTNWADDEDQLIPKRKLRPVSFESFVMI